MEQLIEKRATGVDSKWSEMGRRTTSVIFMRQKSTNKLQAASGNLVLSFGGKKGILIKSVKSSRWMLRVQPWSLRAKQRWLAGLRRTSQEFMDYGDKMSRQLTNETSLHN